MSSTHSGSGSQQSRKRIPAEQRRRELTAVAHTVMARDGAFGLTTRAVAKEAGVPHGSVHYAFHSKDELIRAVVRDDIDRSTAAFRRFAAPEANTPEHAASPPEQATGSAAAPVQTEQVVSPEGILHAAFASYADNLIGDPWEEAAQQEPRADVRPGRAAAGDHARIQRQLSRTDRQHPGLPRRSHRENLGAASRYVG